MGQGAESCGAYESAYDPYEDGVGCGIWTQRDGTQINIEDMSVKHLRGAMFVAQRAAQRAIFSDEEHLWNDWVSVLLSEIGRRESKTNKNHKQAVKIKPRGKVVEMVCHCGAEYKARAADIDRGWGMSCSKRCAAIRRKYKKPPAKRKAMENASNH